ncbi:hypothetical protein [Rhodopirellula sp. MGV]|uniref:hypothetical protein n=1 Tax=Rhodopirellula sp. MGV TaxID=2023130 RepID=UPI000B95D368|nr:hypothetical protein [Rhodopirellula sp. MGV]OYP33968.1 hypothetical protein CGZ80_17495 [Rhodopirellula sp. MGV]PNY37247.1 hypothetical protein C2E31_08790 [Rhodopirellula baltica]
MGESRRSRYILHGVNDKTFARRNTERVAPIATNSPDLLVYRDPPTLKLRNHASEKLVDSWQFSGSKNRRLPEQCWAGVFHENLLSNLFSRQILHHLNDRHAASAAGIFQHCLGFTYKQTTESAALNIA